MPSNSSAPWGPMTVLVIIVVTLVVLVGGVTTIVNPGTLTFNQYLDALTKAAFAAAGLGIGRGVQSGLHAIAKRPALVGEALSSGAGPFDSGDIQDVTLPTDDTSLKGASAAGQRPDAAGQ